MAISGSQQAYKQARAGVARSGTTRSDYFTTRILIVLIGGVDRTANVEKGTLSIRDVLNEQPDTASMEIFGVTPTAGAEVVIATGSNDNRIFGGKIVSPESLSVNAGAAERWRINCTDYTWLMNKKRVTGQFSSQAAHTLAVNILATYAPSFTVRHVQTSSPTIEAIKFTGTLLSDVMSELCRKASTTTTKWNWYVDAYQDLHFFASETTGGPANITTSNYDYERLTWRPTIDQIRTRVYVQGGGGVTTDPVAVGATTIPVDECGWYLSAGGTVLINSQVVTYTGRSASSGPGNLTGVTGVAFALLEGDAVDLWVTVNDTAAQTALAAREGGDGIREGFLSDGRLGYASCVELGEQELALRGLIDNTGSYTTRDKRTKSGKTITVTLPARGISGESITIQSVTRKYQAPHHWTFDVEFQRVQRNFLKLIAPPPIGGGGT